MIKNPSYERAKCECFIVPFVGLFQIIFLIIGTLFSCIRDTFKQCCMGFTLNKEEQEAVRCMREAKKRMRDCTEVVTGEPPKVQGKYVRGTWGNSTLQEECGTCIGIFQPITEKQCKKLMKNIVKCQDKHKNCKDEDLSCTEECRKKTRSICQEIKQVKCTCKKTKCKKCKVNKIPVVIYNQAKVCKQNNAKCQYKPPQFMECKLRSFLCEPACGKKNKKAHKPIQYYECYRHGGVSRPQPLYCLAQGSQDRDTSETGFFNIHPTIQYLHNKKSQFHNK